MTSTAIDVRPVVSTTDLGTRPERDITEITAGLLKLSERVVAHWGEIRPGVRRFYSSTNAPPPHD